MKTKILMKFSCFSKDHAVNHKWIALEKFGEKVNLGYIQMDAAILTPGSMPPPMLISSIDNEEIILE